METLISATEANRRFSELLRGVRKGKTYVITSHGERVARLAAEAIDPAERKRRERAMDRIQAHWRHQSPTQLEPWTREEIYTRGNSGK